MCVCMCVVIYVYIYVCIYFYPGLIIPRYGLARDVLLRKAVSVKIVNVRCKRVKDKSTFLLKRSKERRRNERKGEKKRNVLERIRSSNRRKSFQWAQCPRGHVGEPRGRMEFQEDRHYNVFHTSGFARPRPNKYIMRH